MRYLAARNVTDGSEVTMQMPCHLDATWERSSGRVEPAGSAPQRPARDSVMASPFPAGGCCNAEFYLGVAAGAGPYPPGKGRGDPAYGGGMRPDGLAVRGRHE